LAGAAVSVASDARATAEVFATGATNALAPLRARAAMIRCIFLRAEMRLRSSGRVVDVRARGNAIKIWFASVEFEYGCFACLSQRALSVSRFESTVLARRSLRTLFLALITTMKRRAAAKWIAVCDRGLVPSTTKANWLSAAGANSRQRSAADFRSRVSKVHRAKAPTGRGFPPRGQEKGRRDRVGSAK